MKFSDEMISAYADGELQGGEKTEFESVLEHDIELQQALAHVNGLKLQLHEAYHQIEIPAHVQQKTLGKRMAAYAMLLMLVFGSGWMSGDLMHEQSSPVLQAALQSENASPVTDKVGRYILHIGTHDNAKFKRALDEVEVLLVNYSSSKIPVELEVIANAGGLNLLRNDGSAFAQKVKRISEQYPNVKFIACSNAIERLREQGIEPNLINTVRKGPTALDQVVRRMNEGWTYVKI